MKTAEEQSDKTAEKEQRGKGAEGIATAAPFPLFPSAPLPSAHPPLLLHRRPVLELLGWNPKVLWQFRHEGDIRCFCPDPGTRWGYYYAIDVARICNRPFALDWLEGVPEELTPDEFAQHSGLARWAIYIALRRGTLGQRRAMQGVRLPKSELRKFC